MRFTLVQSPYPEGYGEALLPLAECKAHLRVDGDDEDDLIAALRDAALQFVERDCEVRLRETAGMVWRAEGLPLGRDQYVELGVRPVVAIESLAWLDTVGGDVAGAVSDFRISGDGLLRPAIGGDWPRDVGGGVAVTFTAGFADGEAPDALLQAARMMLAHLYANREAVITGTINGPTPLGVAALMQPWRQVRI